MRGREPTQLGARAGDALDRDGPRRPFSGIAANAAAPVQRRPVPGSERRCRSSPSISASDRRRRGGLARRRARDLRHLPGAGPRPARAPQARRRVHAARAGSSGSSCRRSSSRCASNGTTSRPPRSPTASPATATRPCEAVKDFHHELCHLRILDPACGSGNFLYVTMEHMKRLEGEVLDLLRNDLDEPEATLDLERPHRRSAPVPRHRDQPARRDDRRGGALDRLPAMALSDPRPRHARPAGPQELPQHRVPRRHPRLRPRASWCATSKGSPVTRWDGHSMKTDLADRPRGARRDQARSSCTATSIRARQMAGRGLHHRQPAVHRRQGFARALRRGYAEALWAAYPDMPRSADFVMYWWRRAADLVRTGKARRFGLITTNSLPQTFNRRVVAAQLDAEPPLGLVFAIPDHPWYLGGDMAAVRIAMTVGVAGKQEGQLFRVVDPRRNAAQGGDDLRSSQRGVITSNLTIGVDVGDAMPLLANGDISCPGVKLHGSGFIVTRERAMELGLGKIPGLQHHIRPYRNGRDLTGRFAERDGD